MGHTTSHEAIILKTYDIGDADRFCIVFTKERGKLAARAKAVRKLHSKLGGHLLPFESVTIDLYEGSSGFLITAAKRGSDRMQLSPQQFLAVQQGIEMILHLVDDLHPLPEVFALLQQFLREENPDKTLLPFTLCLLSELGYLPETTSEIFRSLSDEEKLYIKKVDGNWNMLPTLSPNSSDRIFRIAQSLMNDAAHVSLKSTQCTL